MNIDMLRMSGSLVKLWSKEGLPKVSCAARNDVPDGRDNLPCSHSFCVVVIISFCKYDVNFLAPVLKPCGVLMVVSCFVMVLLLVVMGVMEWIGLLLLMFLVI